MSGSPAAGAATAPAEPDLEVWSGGYSAKAMYGAWLGCGVLTVVAVIIGIVAPPSLFLTLLAVAVLWLLALGAWLYRRLAIYYRLTKQRLLHEKGILSRVTDRIELIDIDDIRFTQGLVERLVGVGTITITSSDQTDPNLVMTGIDRVAQVAAQIDDLRRLERNRRGLFVESI